MQLLNNYTLKLENVTYENKGNYTCEKRNKTLSKYCMIMYGRPNISIRYQGKAVHKLNISTDLNTINFTCLAHNIPSAVNLTWSINQSVTTKGVGELLVIPDPNNVDMFNVLSSFMFHPLNTVNTISCFTESPLQQAITTVTVYEPNKEDLAEANPVAENQSVSTLLTVVITLMTTLLISFVCLTLIIIRRRGCTRESASDYSYTPSMVPEDEKTQQSSEPDRGACCSSLTMYELSIHKDTGKLSKENPNYLDIESVDNYDVIPEISPETEVFQRKNVNFIASLKKGYFFDRWTAVISVPEKADKCVFASTIAEHMLHDKNFHWGNYVKKLLEFGNQSNLLKIEGICLDADRMYVLYEHLPDTSLTNHIETHSPMETRLRYLMDIVNGIIFIHCQGFLHPGFSANKVLLSQGKCKLYDFLLSQDAPTKVKLMKRKPGCNLSHLPPESFNETNEYSSASDLWCISLLMWQLFTFGQPPRLTANTSGHPEIPSKPNELSENLYSIVLRVWKTEPRLRPSTATLKEALENMSTYSKEIHVENDIAK
ncbi:tyrosine-protein kinase FRK-like isoform X2 [Apostichopus japonicus]